MASPDLTSIALHRFGLGAAPGERARAGADPRGYVLRQIGGTTALPGDLPASDAAIRQMRFAELVRQDERMMENRMEAGAGPANPQQPLPAQTIFRDEAAARFDTLATTDRPLVERLAAFWANHFAIGVNKAPLVRVSAGAFEREAIRPHLFGRFADMLRAVAQHPAMLIYLDNFQSIGPDSRIGQKARRGLNENLAREILELHTLGVDGGYTQQDVTNFARILTGWTMVAPAEDALYGGRFTFSPVRHEPGPQVVMGKEYADTGLDQGLATLDDLARSPATARHISFKLARHFIADDPPPALIRKLADVFSSSGGDLLAVTRALVTAPESWSTPPGKIRSPLLFIAALSRAAPRRPPAPAILGELGSMGQPLWNPPGPNGFPDTADAWASPENMVVRLDVSAHWGRLNAGLDPRRLVDETLGEAASPATRDAVTRAETRAQALALLFMSPEFQHC